MLNTTSPGVGFSVPSLNCWKFGYHWFHFFVHCCHGDIDFTLNYIFTNFKPYPITGENFIAIGQEKTTFKAIEKYRYGLWKNCIETPWVKPHTRDPKFGPGKTSTWSLYLLPILKGHLYLRERDRFSWSWNLGLTSIQGTP